MRCAHCCEQLKVEWVLHAGNGDGCICMDLGVGQKPAAHYSSVQLQHRKGATGGLAVLWPSSVKPDVCSLGRQCQPVLLLHGSSRGVGVERVRRQA